MTRTQLHVERGIGPLVGVLALIAVTVVLSAVVVGSLTLAEPSSSGPNAGIKLTVDGSENEFLFTHRTGDPIDVTQLSIRVTVEDEPLSNQPPVPFFSAAGFESGPTGPFNTASGQEWGTGERASFTVASTNEPPLASGDRVAVTLAVEDRTIAVLDVVAE